MKPGRCNVAVVRSVQRHIAKSNSGSSCASSLSGDSDKYPAQEERSDAALKNARLPKIEGTVTQYSCRGPLDIFGEVHHPRWFELDPAAGTLSYWEASKRSGPPIKSLQLEQLVDVDWNEPQCIVMLTFGRGSRFVRFALDNHSDFVRWMGILGCYPAGSTWFEDQPENKRTPPVLTEVVSRGTTAVVLEPSALRRIPAAGRSEGSPSNRVTALRQQRTPLMFGVDGASSVSAYVPEDMDEISTGEQRGLKLR